VTAKDAAGNSATDTMAVEVKPCPEQEEVMQRGHPIVLREGVLRGRSESAGINRHRVGDERALHERSS